MNKQRVVIIGAGPAGLTAGIELQKLGFSNIEIIEQNNLVGGISRTECYRGNRIDIGGHRFFSKSSWVMDWWQNFLPLMSNPNQNDLDLTYKGQSKRLVVNSNLVIDSDQMMLIKRRISRIYFNRQFFDYPLQLTISTLRKIGLKKTINFGFSYLLNKVKPRKPEKTLEDFLINRFGKKLFEQFFKEYTEKVWGVPCSSISAEWGSQRIKSLSIGKTILYAIKKKFKVNGGEPKQTSLIDYFIYPKYGPGQMWETVAKEFIKQGGIISLNSNVSKIQIENNKVHELIYTTSAGDKHTITCDQLISTMPIKDLVVASSEFWNDEIQQIAKNLPYRDFITVGLLYESADIKTQLIDNWIYIQEPGVKVGRIQVFNNWSSAMVADEKFLWLGLEYFCQESDELWKMSDSQIKEMAQYEIYKIGLVDPKQSKDSVVIKVPKAYPGYFGESYEKFNILKTGLDKVNNLFLVGRNGMHRYNNQDHSMLTAAEAAKQISTGVINKNKIWSINIDDAYHEEIKN